MAQKQRDEERSHTDKRTAAGIYVTLSISLIGATFSMMAFSGTLFLFFSERHQATTKVTWSAVLGIAAFFGGVICGGQGINDIATDGYGGGWHLRAWWFFGQTALTFLAIALVSRSLYVLVGCTRIPPAGS